MSEITSRINHAAEARLALEYSERRVSANWIAETGEAKSDIIAVAQAHATLALVEQQRIANLIALSESGRTTANGARAALSGLYDGDGASGSASMALRDDIAQALGIDGDDNE